MSCIFKKAHTFIGNVEEDDCCSKDTACADDLYIKNVRNPNEQENQHLSADTFEADFTGKRVIADGAHDTGNVINDHERDECIKQAITAS